MTAILKIVAAVLQAFFGIWGSLSDPVDRPGAPAAANPTPPRRLSTKTRVAIVGICATAIFSVATEIFDYSERQEQAERTRTLQQLVASLREPIKQLKVSVDFSVAANRPEFVPFLQNEPPRLDLTDIRWYRGGDVYAYHPTVQLDLKDGNLNQVAAIKGIAFYVGIYKTPPDQYPQNPNVDSASIRPFRVPPDARFDIIADLSNNNGKLFHDTIIRRVIQRFDDIEVNVTHPTTSVIGVDDLPASTIMFIFNVSTLPHIDPDARLECVSLTVPNGPSIDIPGGGMKLPPYSSSQLEITYRFPADLDKTVGATCNSRGRASDYVRLLQSALGTFGGGYWGSFEWRTDRAPDQNQ